MVKEIEKRFLGRKYAYVSAAHVRQIGIDEIHIGRNSDRTFRFLTIVRDLQSGAVIHVGNGKGVSALDGLSKKLRKKKLKVVSWICPMPTPVGWSGISSLDNLGHGN